MNKGLGIGATLIGGLIGILGSYLWFALFQGQELNIGNWRGAHIREEELYRSWYLFFIAILMIRHFLRILFLERQVDYPIKKNYRKKAFVLLLIVTIIGFFLKTLLPISASVFNNTLLGYSLLFALFGIITVAGFDEDEANNDYLKINEVLGVEDLSNEQKDELRRINRDKKTAVWASVFTDISAILICALTPYLTRDDLAMIMMAGAVFFAVEANTLYGKQIKNQFSIIVNYLNK